MILLLFIIGRFYSLTHYFEITNLILDLYRLSQMISYKMYISKLVWILSDDSILIINMIVLHLDVCFSVNYENLRHGVKREDTEVPYPY